MAAFAQRPNAEQASNAIGRRLSDHYPRLVAVDVKTAPRSQEQEREAAAMGEEPMEGRSAARLAARLARATE
jgi:hypothetical protein